MKKLSVTYKAPKGDSKVVEAWGHTFYDGKAEQVTLSDEFYEEATGNRFFELGKVTDVTPQEAEAEKEKAERPTEQHGKRI